MADTVQGAGIGKPTLWQQLTDRIDRLDPCERGCKPTVQIEDFFAPDGLFNRYPLYNGNMTATCIVAEKLKGQYPGLKITPHTTLNVPNIGTREIDCDQAAVKLNFFVTIAEHVSTGNKTGQMGTLRPETAFTEFVTHEIIANLVIGQLDIGLTTPEITESALTDDVIKKGVEYAQEVCETAATVLRKLPQDKQEALKKTPQYAELQRCLSFTVKNHEAAITILASIAQEAGLDGRAIEALKK